VVPAGAGRRAASVVPARGGRRGRWSIGGAVVARGAGGARKGLSGMGGRRPEERLAAVDSAEVAGSKSA
jgi:hypothetical protein